MDNRDRNTLMYSFAVQNLFNARKIIYPDIQKSCNILYTLAVEHHKLETNVRLLDACYTELFRILRKKIKNVSEQNSIDATVDIMYPDVSIESADTFRSCFRTHSCLNQTTKIGININIGLIKAARINEEEYKYQLDEYFNYDGKNNTSIWMKDFVILYNLWCMVVHYKHLLWRCVCKVETNFDIQQYLITEQFCENYAKDFRREFMKR